MTQETVGYVELEWTCRNCGTRNPGTAKVCSNCGAAMSENDKFDLPTQQQLIQDEAKLKEAERGPDIVCPFCGTRNAAGTKNCSQCGGDLTKAAARQTGEVLGAFQPGAVPDVPCPFCGTLNPAIAKKCKNCGGTLAKPAAPKPAVAGSPSRAMPLVAVVVLLLCGLGIAFIYFGTRTTDLVGTVQAVQWERTIAVLEQRPVEHEDWSDQIPAGAQKGSCTQKVRKTVNEPVAGAAKVCGTPYAVDQGSGVAKVVQDCQYQVSDSWCKYTVNEWTVVATQQAKGVDLNPAWPALNLTSAQREGDRGEQYQVVFDADGRRLTYTPQNGSQFTQFKPGSRWVLKVNTFGGVSQVQPAP